MVAARDTGLLRVVDDRTELPPQLASAELDAGERSAIALALEQQATLLVDERRGRSTASSLGLRVLGTLGLLVMARDAGCIDRVRPLVDALLAGGYFLAQPLVDRTLAAIGE